MPVTFGGWAPAPEPSVDARIAMSMMPQLADVLLRQQSPEGQLDLELKRQQMELARQKFGLEQQRLAHEAMMNAAQIEHLGAQTGATRFGTERGRQMLPGELLGQTLGQQHVGAQNLLLGAQTKNVEGETGLFGPRAKEVEARTKYTTAQTEALPGPGVRDMLTQAEVDKLRAEADKAKIQLRQEQGKQDFESWDETSKPTTEGLAYARPIYRALQMQLMNLKAKMAQGQIQGLDTSADEEDFNVLADEFIRFSKYLGKSGQKPKVKPSPTKEQLLKDNPGLSPDAADKILARTSTPTGGSEFNRRVLGGGGLGLGTAMPKEQLPSGSEIAKAAILANPILAFMSAPFLAHQQLLK